MSPHTPSLRFFVKAVPAEGARPNEFARAMAPHPLIDQERGYEPEYSIYNRRLTATRMNGVDAERMYWLLRRQVTLRHTGELPLELRGPDALRLLDRVFTRDVTKTRVGRCSYQLACYDDGGMLTDGLLLRLADDRFWFCQAEGQLYSWLRAHARGLDVEVLDPQVWISQVQGPASLDVLRAAIDGAYPEPFRCFDVAVVSIAGQEVVLTRTGFTNELGFEFYLGPDIDAAAVGERLLEAGREHGIMPVSGDVYGTRRIEAGLLFAGVDFDESTTPFTAGLGAFVELDKPEFAGKAALGRADRRRRTWGMRVQGGVARTGETLWHAGAPAGRTCSSGFSPFQRCGVALVRVDDADLGPGTTLDVECTDGEMHSGTLCDTPMFDEKREIPRGKRVDIPEIPGRGEG